MLLLVFFAVNISYAQSREQSFVWSLTGTDYQRGNIHFPAHIANVRISDYPVVGQAVMLEVEVTSSQNEPNLQLDLQLPDQIQVIEGNLHWHGSLSANETHHYNLVIVVQEAGFHHINLGLLSPPTKAKSYIDGVSIFIETNDLEAQIIRGHELQVTQSEYRYEVSPDNVTLSANRASASGTITLEGQVRYEANIGDCFGGPCDALVSNLIPERAVIQLWDAESAGERLLAESTISASGDYAFTVPNSDTDGTGIDPIIKILATDNERAEIVNSSEELYSVLFSLGTDLVDGSYTHSLNIASIPPDTTVNQAFYIFDLMVNNGYDYLAIETGWTNTDMVQVNWPQGCVFGLVDNSCYVNEAIYMYVDDGVQTDVILHEYGHFVLSRDVGDFDVVNACAPVYTHIFGAASISTACAWSEGWADFFEMTVQGSSNYRGVDVEAPANLPTTAGDHATYWESLVAATLWDIFDGGVTEPFDVINDGFNGTSGWLLVDNSKSQPPKNANHIDFEPIK